MLNDSDISKSLDLKRETCACPLVDTHEALKSMKAGQVLEVITDHRPAAQELIPNFCENRRCPVRVVEDGRLWRILIKKDFADADQGATQPVLELKNLDKSFTAQGVRSRALEDVDLTVRAGEFVCLVGPSGCGKSTLLNIVAGLDRADGGDVLIEGSPVAGPGSDRVVIFQEPALFPWLDVVGNVEFGLKVAKMDKVARRERARDLLRLVHLSRFESSYVHHLSGGMKQRVALARALALDPKILLMDEPFTALDAQTRHLLHLELREIWLATHKTILFVTHNVREAVSLADRVIVLSAGPVRVKKEYQIELTRPRDDNDPLVSQVVRQITGELKSEIDKVVRDEFFGKR